MPPTVTKQKWVRPPDSRVPADILWICHTEDGQELWARRQKDSKLWVAFLAHRTGSYLKATGKTLDEAAHNLLALQR